MWTFNHSIRVPSACQHEEEYTLLSYFFQLPELMGAGEDSRESLGLQGDPTSPSYRKSVLNIHWKDWC